MLNTLSNLTPGLDIGIVEPVLVESLMSFAVCLDEHLVTNELVNLVIDNNDGDPHPINGRITIERTASDGWTVEIVPGFRPKAVPGALEFCDLLAPSEQNAGRRLVGPHTSVREATTDRLGTLLVRAAEILILHHELFNCVRITFVEDLASFSDGFAKSIRSIVRCSGSYFALGKKKLRDGLIKDSDRWMPENLRQLESVFPGIIVSKRLVNKRFAVMVTRDAKGWPRSVFYVKNLGKKFDVFAVFRWNGTDFVPTDTDLFEMFVPKDYIAQRACGPDFATDTEILYFFPEVASRLGISTRPPRDDASDD